MSLIGFLKLPDVKARVKVLRPTLPRTIGLPLLVVPRSNRCPLIGTAFDYLLRFELERRARGAITRAWIAHRAVEESPLLSSEVRKRLRVLLESARCIHRQYVARQSVAQRDQEELAEWAVRLARIDPVFRALKFGESPFSDVPGEDVQELTAMLEIVPFDSLIGLPLMLNPAFGDSSVLIGGADADLLVTDTLIDVKTTKKDAMDSAGLDQLLGYFLLARDHRKSNPSFPEIKRFGIYFSRHGYIWTQPTSLWTDQLTFLETEKWFIEECKRRQNPRRSFADIRSAVRGNSP